jgi:hypothetical protein
MNDYRKWPEKPINVTSLTLDAQNPRIPHSHGNMGERELIAQLIEYDKVYELARSIAEQGYFPTEVLIGIEEKGRKVVLEGNRRLAALKLLISPSVAPKQLQAKFSRLSAQVAPELISKVRVAFAPSREAAAPIIVKRHTTTGVEKWKPAQQGQYIRSFVRDEISLDELGKQLGLTKSEIVAALRYDTLYEVAQSLSLPPDVSKIVKDPRSFSMTTLERLVDNPRVPKFLGISFDSEGGFKGKVRKEEFVKGFSRIITDIARKKIDSRKLNDDDQIKNYLSGLSADTPNQSKSGSFTSDGFLDTSNDISPSSDEEASPEPRGPRKSKGLIPATLKSHLAAPRINEIVNELKRLSVADYPNTTAVMFRVLLDVLVSHFMDSTGRTQVILERERRKNNKRLDWYPTLRQLLKEYLYDPNQSFSINPQARKVMQKMVEDDDHLFSINHMDQFVHNKFAAPTEAQLRKFWAAWEEFIKHLLVEYPNPAVMATGKSK